MRQSYQARFSPPFFGGFTTPPTRKTVGDGELRVTRLFFSYWDSTNGGGCPFDVAAYNNSGSSLTRRSTSTSGWILPPIARLRAIPGLRRGKAQVIPDRRRDNQSPRGESEQLQVRCRCPLSGGVTPLRAPAARRAGLRNQPTGRRWRNRPDGFRTDAAHCCARYRAVSRPRSHVATCFSIRCNVAR
jgi:hypothetical protein